MAGTLIGGRRAAQTNKERYGEGFYKTMGRKGGQASSNGGFYHAKQHGRLDFIRECGAKGGKISKRRPAVGKPVKIKVTHIPSYYRPLWMFTSDGVIFTRWWMSR